MISLDGSLFNLLPFFSDVLTGEVFVYFFMSIVNSISDLIAFLLKENNLFVGNQSEQVKIIRKNCNSDLSLLPQHFKH